MAINPVSPRANRSPRSALTVCTVPSARRALSTPPRCVNSIVPSGAKAMSQGMFNPETNTSTESVGGDASLPTVLPEASTGPDCEDSACGAASAPASTSPSSRHNSTQAATSGGLTTCRAAIVCSAMGSSTARIALR